MCYGYTKPHGKCPSESVLKAPGKGQILATELNGVWGIPALPQQQQLF
jgi:hypothetical protein